MVAIDALSRAYGHVREELRSLGLLAHGHYLDAIECELSAWPGGFWGMSGFVYDRGVGALDALAGFRDGVIYVPRNARIGRSRGETLRDVVRHEFAHAWAWLDPDVVEGAWFVKTFGAGYDEEWEVRPEFDPEAFVSEYATTAPKEDFAETFMVVLREGRRGLEGKPPRVRLKLEAVAMAIERAGPRRLARGLARRSFARGPSRRAGLDP